MYYTTISTFIINCLKIKSKKMYKDPNKIDSMYSKNKKTNKFNKYHFFIILLVMIILLIVFNIFSNKTNNTQKKIFIQNKKEENILPDKPKEKWKYIKKLENL